MKAIMISIKPKYVADILNHKKTIEVRKTMPKCDLPIDVYIYCTNDKNETCMFNGKKYVVQVGEYAKYFKKNWQPQKHILNGKVVAKFTLNKVEEIRSIVSRILGSEVEDLIYLTNHLSESDICKNARLEYKELKKYLGYGGYAWHISNLVIFDKPKELSEFYRNGKMQSAIDCKKTTLNKRVK